MGELAILYPNNQKYQRFLDQLLEVYRDAKRSASDGRLGEEGRKHRVAELEGRLCEALLPHPLETTPEMSPHERVFTNLINELSRLVMAEELFTFVLVPEVEPTNNGMERELRRPALEREAGRTNKSAAGAHRRSVLVSVLQSLRANLEDFSLTTVLEEIGHWRKGRDELVRKAMAIVAGRGSRHREHRLACSLNRLGSQRRLPLVRARAPRAAMINP